MSDTEEPTISDNRVQVKYKLTGEVVNKVLQHLVDRCVDGASIRSLCLEGESMVLEELKKVLRKDKDLVKGIAFPVCISVNSCISHFSPLDAEDDVTLATGDMVKIDFGAHTDGFIAVVAHTMLVGAADEPKITGRKADVMLAAHYAAEAVLSLFKSGTENSAVTSAVGSVASCFNCNPMDGMLSFQLQQNRIDGEKLIQQSSGSSSGSIGGGGGGGQKKDVEKCTFENYEVYAMDVIVSTGKGHCKEMDTRVTIYKKTEEVYNLRLKCSRDFFRKVSKEHGVMPFNLRSFEDVKKSRMGVMECVSHKLVAPYPVMWERLGEQVAQFKYTVLVLPNGPLRITGLKFNTALYESEYKIEDPALLELFNSMKIRKKRKGKTEPATMPNAATASPAPTAPVTVAAPVVVVAPTATPVAAAGDAAPVAATEDAAPVAATEVDAAPATSTAAAPATPTPAPATPTPAAPATSTSTTPATPAAVATTTPAPTTPAPTTPAPTTPAPTTPAPTTPAATTPATPAPATPAPTTPAPTTPAPTTPAPTTPAPTTPAPTTPAPTTPAPTTPAPTTPATPAPTAPSTTPATPAPITPATPTPATPTSAPTTPAPTTPAPPTPTAAAPTMPLVAAPATSTTAAAAALPQEAAKV